MGKKLLEEGNVYPYWFFDTHNETEVLMINNPLWNSIH